MNMNTNLINLRHNLQNRIRNARNKNIRNLVRNISLRVPFPMKKNYNSIIPANIFQTWHSKKLPPLMEHSTRLIKMLNPKFNYYLYDDNECREFIKTNFPEDVLHAYDSLIPGAYKADLWRYCILFIKGGIYLDIKFIPLNGFKFINLTESEHLVSDINNIDIYNAFMVCLPQNQILFKAIRQIVENVKNKFYGASCLSPTGPKLLTRFISTKHKIVDLKHRLLNDNDYKIIYFNNIPILKSYSGHEVEKTKFSIKKHYSELWAQKRIYK